MRFDQFMQGSACPASGVGSFVLSFEHRGVHRCRDVSAVIPVKFPVPTAMLISLFCNLVLSFYSWSKGLISGQLDDIEIEPISRELSTRYIFGCRQFALVVKTTRFNNKRISASTED